MKPILILIFVLCHTVFAQLQDKIVTVDNISDSCAYGQKVLFRDTNQDNLFDKARKYYCDFSYDDYELIVIGTGIIESGMAGEIIKGKFNQNDFLLRIIDPFKNVIHAYLWFDSTENHLVLDFTVSNVFEIEKSVNYELIINDSFIRIQSENLLHNEIINIFNFSGVILSTSSLDKSRVIDISGLPPGMYFVRVGSTVHKFVKI